MHTLLRRARHRLRALLDRRAVERDMDDEMRLHLEMEAADRRRAGMSAAEARRTATRDFGGLERFKEQSRDERPFASLEQLVRDARHAARLMRRHPTLTATCVLVTALGIGSTTAIFSVVYGVLLRPLPFAAPERIGLMQLASSDDVGMRFAASAETYLAMAGGGPVLEAVAAASPGNVVLATGEEPEQLRVEYVTPSMFPLLGAVPALGRAFTDAEVRDGTPVTLLSHALWRRRFGGDTTVVGRTIRLDGAPHTVLGIMPPEHLGHRLRAPALWLPLEVDPSATAFGGRRPRGANVVVRVRGGVTFGEAATWIDQAIRPTTRDVADAERLGLRTTLVPLPEIVTGNVRLPLLVLLGAVGFVLLLAVVNVATLLLARASAREHELAVRRALGASRGQQLRQLLTESVVLASAGGVLGVGIALAATAYLKAAGGDVLPRLHDVRTDWRVLGVAVLLSLAAGVGAGMTPALRAVRSDLASPFRAGTRSTVGRRRVNARSALVVAELAVCAVLLVGAGLLMKSFLGVVPDQPGFAVADRLAVSVRLRERAGYDDPLLGAERRRAYVEAATRRLAAQPGVRAVAVTSYLPLVGMSEYLELDPEGPAGDGDRPAGAHRRLVSENFFEVMEIPLLRGRGFDDADRTGAPRVAVVSARAAQRWWPDEPAIGKRVTFRFTDEGDARETVEVVGVVGDVRFSGASTRPSMDIYLPYAQRPPGYATFVVHTADDPSSVAARLRREVWAADPTLPVEHATPLRDIVGEAVAMPRFYSTLMLAFAAFAVALAMAGLYGVLAYLVAQRSRELGIRSALGASRGRLVAMVLRQAILLILLGLALGTVGARALTRLLESILVEVSATDPWVFAAMLSLLAVVALAASWVPARRASRADPMAALRSD